MLTSIRDSRLHARGNERNYGNLQLHDSTYLHTGRTLRRRKFSASESVNTYFAGAVSMQNKHFCTLLENSTIQRRMFGNLSRRVDPFNPFKFVTRNLFPSYSST